MRVSFAVRVRKYGVCSDGVTPLKKAYLNLDVKPAFARYYETLCRTLTSHQMEAKLCTLPNLGPCGITLGIPDMYKAQKVIEQQGWQVTDLTNCLLWRYLKDRPANAVDKLTDTHMETKLGSKLWGLLHPYQKVGIKFLVDRQRAYNADEMGTGKTLQSLAACKYFVDQWPVLVVCPSSLMYNWRNEICKWLELEEDQVRIIKTGRHVTHPRKKDQGIIFQFVILSYSLLINAHVKAWVQAQRFRVAVLDECHYVKSMGSQRSKAVTQIVQKMPVCFMLSGTPFNYPSEMYQQLKILYPEIYPEFYHFNRPEPHHLYYGERYCEPVRTFFHGRTQWTFKGYRNHEELHAVLNTFMVRRRKHEILTQLPTKNRMKVYLEPMKAQHEREITKLLASAKNDKQNVSRKDKYSKAFTLTAQYKIAAVEKYVKSFVIDNLLANHGPDFKLLLFMHHSVMQEALENCLNQKNIAYFVINGTTKPQQRAVYTEEFQTTNNYQVALLSINAAGVGLTLTAANTVVFTEVLYGPDQHLQAEDRAHRLGQKNDVNIYYLLSPKSTDLINFGLLLKKERESSKMLDGQSNILTVQNGRKRSQDKVKPRLMSKRQKQMLKRQNE